MEAGQVGKYTYWEVKGQEPSPVGHQYEQAQPLNLWLPKDTNSDHKIIKCFLWSDNTLTLISK